MNPQPEVVIVGVGLQPVGELWDVSLRDLAVRVLRAAREDAAGLRPEAIYVGNMLAASASHQANLGALISEYSGLAGIAEGVTAEAGEASGAAAIYMAYLAIRSGLVPCAAVVGVEKVTDVVGSSVESVLARTLDSDYEAGEGMTTISQAALLLQRYMHENKPPREALAEFPKIAHANAVANPYAMYRKAIDSAAYMRSGMVADPLNLFDVAPVADGAAALILTRRDLLQRELAHPAVQLVASSLISDRLALHDREDPLFFNAAAVSVQRACQSAGMPLSAMDLFEYSDNTTLHAILSLEAAGLAPRGQGWQLASDGSLARDGYLPVATMGGHKARGYPLGAAGVYQAVEACIQLRAEAGGCQVAGAQRAMVQTLAATGSTAVTHILQRLD